MRIHFAGVIHDDPVMPLPLKQWMLNLKRLYRESPAFVAVEWYPEVMDQFCEAWDELVSLAMRDWSCEEQDVAEEVADSIAYEATVAAEEFDVNALWWMSARPAYRHLGREVYSWHWSRLSARGEARTCPSIVKLSVLARVAAARAVRNVDRDRYLAEQLERAVEERPGEWAIAIVGALHAVDCWNDTTRSLVVARGHICDPPAFFGWQPQCS